MFLPASLNRWRPFTQVLVIKKMDPSADGKGYLPLSLLRG